MPETQKLSLLPALLININIMIGAGIFINTVLLAQGAGPISPLVYLLIGVLLFPLIATFSQLLKYHPGGNLYDFAKTINHFSGFLSLWSYFNSKMAAATLGIHVFVSMMQTIFPIFAQVPILILDCIIITLFLWLNMLHMKIGRAIQFSFIIMKMIPILFAIIAGIFLFNCNNLAGSFSWPEVLTTIPFALYAFTGFEAICSVSKKIANPEVNGPLAVLTSFLFVVSINILYQLMFIASLGPELSGLTNYLEAFPALLQKLITQENVHTILQKILHTGIAMSALGVAYGVIYSNSWNLFNLAKRNLVFAPKIFTHLNKHNMPTAAILTEGALAYSYILLTGGYQVPFQQITATGLIITYLLSCAGLFAHVYRTSHKISYTALLGLVSCSILLISQLRNFYTYGIRYLLVFLVIMALGSIMFFVKRNQLTDFESQESNEAEYN